MFVSKLIANLPVAKGSSFSSSIFAIKSSELEEASSQLLLLSEEESSSFSFGSYVMS